MSELRGVLFHRAMAPYEAGDIAGFAPAYAKTLVDRQIGAYYPPEPAAPVVDVLTAMDRDALVAFGHEHLGMADEPPASVSDDDLRAAIRGQVDPELLKPAPAPADAPPAGAPATEPPAGGKGGKKG